MNKYLRLGSLAACLVLLSACANLPAQTVFLHPDVSVPTGNVGKGKNIGLRVLDERQDKIVGYRNMDTSRSAPITVEGGLTGDIGDAASKVLMELGFQVVPPSEGGSRSLTIAVRELSYKASSLTVTKKVTVKCVLAARATSGPGIWEGSYPVSHEKEVVMTPDVDANARALNDVLTESLTSMLADPALVQFLGRESAQGKLIK